MTLCTSFPVVFILYHMTMQLPSSSGICPDWSSQAGRPGSAHHSPRGLLCGDGEDGRPYEEGETEPAQQAEAPGAQGEGKEAEGAQEIWEEGQPLIILCNVI